MERKAKDATFTGKGEEEEEKQWSSLLRFCMGSMNMSCHVACLPPGDAWGLMLHSVVIVEASTVPSFISLQTLIPSSERPRQADLPLSPA